MILMRPFQNGLIKQPVLFRFGLAASQTDCIFKIMTLKAIVHKAEEGGFWAEVPALPGCMTQGETIAESKANLREAVELWLSVGEEAAKSEGDDEVLEMSV